MQEMFKKNLGVDIKLENKSGRVTSTHTSKVISN